MELFGDKSGEPWGLSRPRERYQATKRTLSRLVQYDQIERSQPGRYGLPDSHRLHWHQLAWRTAMTRGIKRLGNLKPVHWLSPTFHTIWIANPTLQCVGRRLGPLTMEDSTVSNFTETVADMEHVVTHWQESQDMPAYTVLSPSRCKACWGPLFGRGPEHGSFSVMRCRVCGFEIKGDEATREYQRISDEAQRNALRIRCGERPEYGEGPFLQKAIIVEPQLSRAEAKTRIACNLKRGRQKKQNLTRSAFPLGTAGSLFMQAKILVSGVRDVYGVHGKTVTDYEIVDLPDGRFQLDLSESAGQMKRDPQYQEFAMMGRLGCQMSAAMLAAFACELLMKVISMTQKDETPKSHDLMELYLDLPEASRHRLVIDYPQIPSVLEEGRHVFGNWRYFENNAGPESLKGMIDLERTLRLAKSARVLLDEGTLVGLYGGATMKVRETIRGEGATRERAQQIKLTITSGESPRKTTPLLEDPWEIVDSTSSSPAKWRSGGVPSRLSFSATRDEQEFDLKVSTRKRQDTADAGQLSKTSTIGTSNTTTDADESAN